MENIQKIISLLQKEISQEYRDYSNKIDDLVSGTKSQLKITITDKNTWKGVCDKLEGIIYPYQSESENQLKKLENSLLNFVDNK